MSSPTPPVWSPGGPVYPVGGHPGGPGWYGAPVPDTNLAKERAVQYLLDALISAGLALVGLLAFVPAIVARSTPLALVGLVVFLLGSYAASAWVEVFRAHRNDGQTYGMSALGLRVVDAATLGPPTLGQLAVRWILLVMVEGGLIALLLIVVTEKHQRVGDMAAKTLVVRADDPLVAATRAATPSTGR